MAIATGDLNFQGISKATNLPLPISPQDAATKIYVDNSVTNISNGMIVVNEFTALTTSGGNWIPNDVLIRFQIANNIGAITSTVWYTSNGTTLTTIPAIGTDVEDTQKSLQTTTNSKLTSIDTKTPPLGQALAISSTPVVLTAVQITALTPPTPINALTNTQLRASALPISGTVNIAGSADLTVFNEQQVALNSSQMNFKPTWGITTFRYKKITVGIGAISTETNGEFRLQTGTTAASVSSIETNQRGQYQSGTTGQVGIGVRLPTVPVGTQYARWGYSDFVNSGFYFGQDITGIYVAYITGGIETKTYQANWNGDKLNGIGASGLNLILANGTISQIDFTWYGYGDIKFSFLIFNATTLKTQKIVAHTIKINNSASIVDPNQPLKFEVGNGTTSTTDFSLYIGGHQFSIVAGFSKPQKRLISELVSNYATALNTNWQPLIAFRKKALFNGRPNSVNVTLENFEVSADGELEVRVTTGGLTSNLTFANPTGITTTETAIETKVTGTIALAASLDGNPSDYGFVSAANKSTSSYETNTKLILGDNVQVILWVRRLILINSVTVKHAHITWEEEW